MEILKKSPKIELNIGQIFYIMIRDTPLTSLNENLSMSLTQKNVNCQQDLV